jgi:hypothetical protein
MLEQTKKYVILPLLLESKNIWTCPGLSTCAGCIRSSTTLDTPPQHHAPTCTTFADSLIVNDDTISNANVRACRQALASGSSKGKGSGRGKGNCIGGGKSKGGGEGGDKGSSSGEGEGGGKCVDGGGGGCCHVGDRVCSNDGGSSNGSFGGSLSG